MLGNHQIMGNQRMMGGHPGHQMGFHPQQMGFQPGFNPSTQPLQQIPENTAPIPNAQGKDYYRDFQVIFII